MVVPADRHPQRLQLVIVLPVSHDLAAFEAPDVNPPNPTLLKSGANT